MKEKILQNKKIVILSLLMMFFFSISMIIAYKSEWSSAMIQPWSVCTVENANKSSIFKLSNDKPVSLDVKPASDQLTGISIYLSYNENEPKGYIDVQLLDKTDEELIQEWRYNLNEINSMDGFVNFSLDEIYEVNREDIYTIKLEAHDLENCFPNLLKAAVSSESLWSNMKEGEEEYNYAFSFRLLNGSCFALKGIFCVFAFLILLTVVIVTVLILEKKGIHIIFVFAALGIGLVYMFLIPPYAVPDEASHFVTAYAESSILMGKEAIDEEGKVIVEEDGTSYIIREERPTKNSYVRYIKGALGKTDFVKMEESSTRNPLSMRHPGYYPQVIGITIARILSFNCEQLLLMGRLIALLWYCFVMYWAIKLIPRWKTMMFLIGLFPMTIQQVASYNYDSVLFGACFFTFSYILNLKFEKKYVTKKDIVIVLLGTAVIASIKFVYLPILGLAFLIPKEKFKGAKYKGIAGALTVLAAGIMILYTNLTRLGGVVNSSTTSLARDNTLTSYNLQTIIGNPIGSIVIFYRTLEFHLSEYLDSMFASPLGWWDISLPIIVSLGFFVLLMISVMMDNEKYELLIKEKVSILVFGIGIVFLVMVSMLLGYTYVGSRTILGIQGRYFLPVLPMLLIGLQSKNFVLQKNNIERYIPLFTIALHAYVVWKVSMTVICR